MRAGMNTIGATPALRIIIRSFLTGNKYYSISIVGNIWGIIKYITENPISSHCISSVARG